MRYASVRKALVGLLLGTACTPSAPPLARTQQGILGGELDLTHDAVVAIRQLRDAESVCSGVVYSIDHERGLASVLTAAHCLREGLPSVIVVGPDYTATDTQRFVPVDAAVHSQFERSNNESPYDIAVLRVAGDVSRLHAIELATENDVVEPGTAVLAVGYGLVSLDGGAATTQRRSAELVVSRVDELGVLVDQSDGIGICSGDSGGPLLVHEEGGAKRIVAVHSRVIPGALDQPPCLGESVSWPVAGLQGFLRAAATAEAPTACTTCRGAAESEAGSCLALRRACEGRSSCAPTLACLNRCSEMLCKQQCKQAAPPDELAALEAIDRCACEACSDRCPSSDVCTGPSPSLPLLLDAGGAADAAPAFEVVSEEPRLGGGCGVAPRRDASSGASLGGSLALILLLAERSRTRRRS